MRKAAIGALFTAALGITACETYYDGHDGYGRGGYGGYDYVGRDYERLGNDCGFFRGSGGDLLDPWLACTSEGQGIVRRGFDSDDDGSIGRDTADRANIWFRRHADTDRDMRLTDPEIRAALVNGERHGDGRY
jgi:hypothetical protein